MSRLIITSQKKIYFELQDHSLNIIITFFKSLIMSDYSALFTLIFIQIFSAICKCLPIYELQA